MSASKADKVQKLLNMAESYAREGNEAAAQSYTDQAQRLIVEYSIDQALLDDASRLDREKIIFEPFVYGGEYGRSKLVLASEIAKAFGLQVVFNRQVVPGYGKAQSYVAFVAGFAADIGMYTLMVNSLMAQEDAFMWNAWKEHKKKLKDYQLVPTRKTQVDFKTSHIEGFAGIIFIRILEMRNRVSQERGSGTELVLKSRAEEVKEQVAETFPEMGQEKVQKDRPNFYGTMAGQNDALRADIGQTKLQDNSSSELTV